MSEDFRVGLTADFRPAPGGGRTATGWGDIGLELLDDQGVTWDFLAHDVAELAADDVAGFDAVIVGAPAVGAAALSGATPPLLIARFGVGYDSVDLDACTAAGTAVSITPDGSRRPVAVAAVLLMLAVQHNLVAKDRLVREGRWADKLALNGVGLTGRTVGVVGLGNVGSEIVALLRAFDAVVLGYDPRVGDPRAAELDATLTDLDTLLRDSDAVILTAALTPQTHHLLDATRLARMKPTAVLVNVARGPLVDTAALVAALDAGQLRGAGLDVFEQEPLPVGHPLLAMDNVTLAPHALAWTDELALGNGRSAMRAVLDAAAGRLPRYVANPAVADHPRWRSAGSGDNGAAGADA